MLQDLADATLRIECGDSSGSGFHFVRPDLIVTNHHVVDEGLEAGESAVAVCEDGNRLDIELRAFSPRDEHDSAVFEVTSELPEGRHILDPTTEYALQRGRELAFSGFPHGIADLLVHQAVVSGHVTDSIFYLDGAVNGGNSGGPIIDLEDGRVVGIVTQRRFLGGQDLDNLSAAADELREHCGAIAGRGSVQLMGIDFGAFADLMAKAMLLIGDVLEANANTGIGIGFSVRFVYDRCVEEGLI